MRTILISTFSLALFACSGLGTGSDIPDVSDISKEQIVREVVRKAIQSDLGAKYPGVPTDGLVNCVIDHATDKEISDLANATLLQSDLGGAVIVAPILKRPETAACIAKVAEN